MGNEIPMGRVVYKGRWKLNIVKCKICTNVKRKDKLFVHKGDSFCNHVGCKKTNKNMRSNVKKRN